MKRIEYFHEKMELARLKISEFQRALDLSVSGGMVRKNRYYLGMTKRKFGFYQYHFNRLNK